MKNPVIITAEVTKEQFTRHYLVLWNGMLHLTEKELDLLEALVNKYIELNVIKDRKYRYDLLFSSQILKEIRNKIGMKEQAFNNYKCALRNKGIIITDGDGNPSLDPRVIPIEEVTFKFKII